MAASSVAPLRGLAAIHAELPAVGALPFVRWLDPPTLLKAAEVDGVLVEPTPVSGPWVMRVFLDGPAGGPYDRPFLVRLRCDAEFPLSSPVMTIQGYCARQPGFGSDGEVLLREHGLVPSLRSLRRLLRRSGGDRQAEAAEVSDTICRYVPMRLHSELFDAAAGWRREWIHPDFVRTAPDWKALAKEVFPEIYSFPVFSEKFCDAFVEEYRHFYGSGLRFQRPNSMNRYGVILNEMGLEDMMSRLQREILAPVAAALFPGAGSHFDNHHSFLVRYKVGEDLGLDMHTDDSDVTFNVCLGVDFEGAGLQFCGNLAQPEHRTATGVFQHRKGHCVMHLGRRRHGADDITKGERVNLIVWNRNSEFRRTTEYQEPRYRAEQRKPDPVCLSYTHDRDFGVFREYAKGTAVYQGQGWCPPPHAEYPGFVAEPP